MSTPIELGAKLDEWAASDRVSVVETAHAVTVTRLDAASAKELYKAVQDLAWKWELHDQAGEPAGPDEIIDALGPYVATVPKVVDGVDRRILTQTGLYQALSEDAGGVWQISCAGNAFATGTTSFNPWGTADVFAPATGTKSPLDVVREASEARLVPADIRKWVLRGEVTEALWQDRAFVIFRGVSAPALIRSVASEVVGQETVVFSGPPRLNLTLPKSGLDEDLGLVGYQNLQAAVSWVYEDTASAEQRHALFAAEFARSVSRVEKIGSAFRTAGRDILEGARLAFQLSQSDLSREAIKAQSDLRRAIADDMSKTAESVRSLSGSIAIAIATGVTLVAARSTGAAEPWVLSLVAVVVAGYLVVVAVNGWTHLNLQRKLREQWRRRFYRFVPADDYDAMVAEPARSAELPYHLIASIALVIAAALVWLAISTWESDPILKQPAPAETNSDHPGDVQSDVSG